MSAQRGQSAEIGFGPAVWAASLEAYPDAVRDLMGLMSTVPLESGDVAWLAGQASAPTPGLEAAIDHALSEVRETGAHMRLGLCSFKRGAGRCLPVATAQQAMTTLRSAGPRVRGIARQVLAEDRGDAIYLRPWRDIPRWCEFRVFIHKRRIVGITQYHLDRRFSEIERYGQEIANSLWGFLGRLIPALHTDTIVADLAVDPMLAKDPVLLELNPYLRRTHPGLFTWGPSETGGDFDGTFRVL